ncbi:hypothetical protein [Brevundimonas sp.]|uniref:hypothetical protein n=1 Tax=Brevundimonas sp. TaxID=1871086 RepID=UPI002D6BA014|nr:hypothetical protein [Brevundimonas sp.]HYD28569.1 hypothetical protein [Brevundimonas sp.]
MQPALFPPPAAREPGDADPAARLLAVVEGLDLASADGRAGIRTLLAEIERLSPGAILQQAASIELRRVGWLCGEASRPGR